MVPTIEVDLTSPIDEIWQKLDKDARWGVNKARREGLIVKEADEQEAKEYYHLYIEMCKRNNVKAHSFDELSLSLNQSYKRGIFICKKDDRVIAGASITEDKNREVISLFSNASIEEYLKLQPNNLIYWEIIVYGKNNNARAFDLGGYELNVKEGSKVGGINRFKERWGGKIVNYPVYSINPFYIIARKLIRKFL